MQTWIAGFVAGCRRPASLRALIAAVLVLAWPVAGGRAQVCTEPPFLFFCNGLCWDCPLGTELCCPTVGNPTACCDLLSGPSCDPGSGACSICGGGFPFECNGECWSCPPSTTLCCPAAGDPTACCPAGSSCDPGNGTCSTEMCGGAFPFECNGHCWSCPEGSTLCCPAVGDPTQCCPAGLSCEPVAGTCTGGGVTCGNGVLDAGEQCDPPQDQACPGQCQSSCTCAPAPPCGNGVVEGNEQCDDGTGNGADKPCTDVCKNAVCGDGTRCSDPACTSGANGGSEECDDGNTVNLDTCGNDCTLVPTVTLNHFKCYKGTFSPFVKRDVTLVDQFHTGTASVLKPDLFCNPVSKDGEPVVSPAPHLKCYKIKPQKLERSVAVFNQFGQQTVTVKKASLLCLPSEKEELPPQLPTLPANVDADGDGFIDTIETSLGSNPSNAGSTPESVAVPRTCLDDVDNDLDGVADLGDPGCAVAAPSEETFPLAGLDVFSSSIELDDFVMGSCLVDFVGEGPTVVQRSNPADLGGGKREIETEIVSMQLTGTATLSGASCPLPQGPVPVTLIETPGVAQRSTGKVTDTNADPAKDFPAESFFDVRFQAHTPLGVVPGTTQVENPMVTSIPPYQTEANPRCYRVQGLPHKHCPKPPPREHYECYKAKFPKFTKRPVTLIDQFGTGTTMVLRPTLFCTPVSKNGEPILNAAGHQTCYKIKPEKIERAVVVRNQFGREDVQVKTPSLLCVPSSKQH